MQYLFVFILKGLIVFTINKSRELYVVCFNIVYV